jgi:hypothetical protein
LKPEALEIPVPVIALVLSLKKMAHIAVRKITTVGWRRGIFLLNPLIRWSDVSGRAGASSTRCPMPHYRCSSGCQIPVYNAFDNIYGIEWQRWIGIGGSEDTLGLQQRPS